MRRLISIVAFALSLAVSLWAQRGGGHAGGHGGGFAGHGGFGGGRIAGGHAFGGMRSGAGFGSRGFTPAPSSRGLGFSARGFRHHGPVIRNFGFNRCFRCRRWGFGWGYPWAGSYDPYWWWDSGSSYDEDYERDRAVANQMNAQSLDEQRMRRQEDQDLYARSAPSPQPREAEPADPTPATVLVFRDRRQLEVQNYAIVGQTLWNFAPQHTQKILLADLDLSATSKANDERGVDFRVPARSEGQ